MREVLYVEDCAEAIAPPAEINGSPFGRLVVMSFGETDKIRMQLEALAIPPDRVFWI